MKKARTIKKIFYGTPTVEGAGVHCIRYFGIDETQLFDPFLLLDDFSSQTQSDYIRGYPWHPHRGIETITYMIKGTVDHSDSLGNHSIVEEEGVQWMTAGSGVIHQEVLLGNDLKTICGFQLWMNLPAQSKMIEPVYRLISSKQIPIIHYSGQTICRLIAGNLDGKSGLVDNAPSDPIFIDVTLHAASEFIFPTPPHHTFFCYLLEGDGNFGISELQDTSPEQSGSELSETLAHMIHEKAVILYTEGDFISVVSGDKPLRFLLIGGKPIAESIAWYGPIVMNTDEELKTAFEEFQVGSFIKHGKKLS